VGTLLVALGACGVVLSLIALVSLHRAAPRIPAQVRKSFVPSLKAEGTPEDIIQNFINGRLLSSNELSHLPDAQAQALISFQESSFGLISITQQSIKVAGLRTLIGTGICAAISLLGLALAAKAVKNVRSD
jgi:hypothetical protein